MRSQKMKPLFEPRPGHFWHLFGAKILPLSLKYTPRAGVFLPHFQIFRLLSEKFCPDWEERE